MAVLLLIMALVIVAITVYAATGRGGGLSVEQPDYAPLDLGPVSATDVVLLRPPTALWGYGQQITDEALERIAESIRQRDVRIVALEQLVTDLSRDPAPAPPPRAYVGQRRRVEDGGPDPGQPAPALSRPAQSQPAPAQPGQAPATPAEPAQSQSAQEQPESAPAPAPFELPWEPARGKPAPAEPAESWRDDQQRGQQQGPPERSHG